MSISKQAAELLLNAGVLRVAPVNGPYFKYSAKPLVGMVYVDCRIIISHNDIKQELAELMAKQVGSDYDAVFGSVTAGMSPAENLARVINAPYFYVRSEVKGYGLNKRIEGDDSLLNGVINYVIAEDLINNGNSIKMIDKAIREQGIITSRRVITAFVTYDNPLINDWLIKSGYEVRVLTTVKELIITGLENGELSEEQAESALEFINDMTGWREARGLPTRPESLTS